MSVYKYRHLGYGAAWGLALDIDCQLVPHKDFDGQVFMVNELIYLGLPHDWKIDTELSHQIIEQMVSALVLLSPQLDKHISLPTVIEIIDAEILPADFQVEVFRYALVGWLCREFDLNFQLPSMIYDKDANKYILP